MTYPWSEPTWICCPNWVCCEVLRLVIVQIISNKADLEGQGVNVRDWGLLRAMRCSRWDLWVQAKTIFITLPACWLLVFYLVANRCEFKFPNHTWVWNRDSFEAHFSFYTFQDLKWCQRKSSQWQGNTQSLWLRKFPGLENDTTVCITCYAYWAQW